MRTISVLVNLGMSEYKPMGWTAEVKVPMIAHTVAI